MKLLLPYQNVSSCKQIINPKNTKMSYGLICVSNDGYILLNKSLPYINTKLHKINIDSVYNCRRVPSYSVSLNEKYNLQLSMFPNATLEGNYSLPKGHTETIDRHNCIFTKVREFIEETKYTHPYLHQLMERHYQDTNFKSFLNDENFIIKEEWWGLDNKRYRCEYSVFFIESMNDLVPVVRKNNSSGIVPFNFFLKNFSIYRHCEQYYKKYKYNSKLDKFKQVVFMKIPEAIKLLNEHKINVFQNEIDSRISQNDITSILEKSICIRKK